MYPTFQTVILVIHIDTNAAIVITENFQDIILCFFNNIISSNVTTDFEIKEGAKGYKWITFPKWLDRGILIKMLKRKKYKKLFL